MADPALTLSLTLQQGSRTTQPPAAPHVCYAGHMLKRNNTQSALPGSFPRVSLAEGLVTSLFLGAYTVISKVRVRLQGLHGSLDLPLRME